MADVNGFMRQLTRRLIGADFDESGLVGAADLLIFLGAFEYPCE